MATSSNREAATSASLRPSAITLRLIVGYKFVKAAAELLLGASLLVLAPASLTAEVALAAEEIRRHVTEMWSIALAERLIRASTERNLLVVAVAIFLDGALSLVEGWALYRRYPWGRWLVVGTTSSLLPVEGVALVHHPSSGRVVLLILNALIVVYLIQRRAAFARKH